MKSVLSVFSDGKKRSEEEKLYLGSVKANVGHGESVSGVIALIKSLMMMERNEIPRHVGIKTKINSGFPTDLDERGIHIARKNTEWKRPEGGARRVMINNFSAAGGNSSVLIEDAPRALMANNNAVQDPRSTHIVAVGAKSSSALTANIKSILAYMDKEEPSLPNLSYTTTARRMHQPYRVMVSSSELSEIRSQLENKLSSPKISQKTRALQRVAFAFTGQGSQWLGMMKELLKFDSFRRDIERFDALCQSLGFPSIAPLMCKSEGDFNHLPPLVTQVGTCCMQMAIAKLWRSFGVEPTMVVGHSLGEYAALNVAGALSEADTIFLCGKRAQLIQENISFNTHAMLAVSTSVQEVHKICKGLEYDIACINGPTETVLSGTNAQIDEALKRVSATSLRKTKLQVPFAFHSSQMQPVLETFKTNTRAVKFQDHKVPIISPLLGEVLTTKEALGPEYLARHCRETVNFVAGIEAAQKAGLQSSTIWVEIGAHPVVSGLLRTNLGATTTTLPTLQRNKDTWKTLSSTMTTLYESGVDIKWAEYHRSFSSSLSVLRLPSYNWDLKEYWMQYTGDWTLYKGSVDFRQGAPALSTSCVHKLIDEKKDKNSVLVVGECDVLRDDVDRFVRGHRVNNVPLVTPSVYAEMALTLGEYLRKQQPELSGCIVDLQHMDVQRPFATKRKGSGPQLLRCCISLDTATFKGSVEFWSVNTEGKKLVRHAEASMTFPDLKKAHAEVTEQAAPILARMKEMGARVHTDDRVQKLSGKTGYQLVSSLAGYDPEYVGVSGVLLDSANLEAVATVNFDKQPKKPAGNFHVNPYLIDNFGQPALFIMNANDQADLSK
jgi:iterative type I PKS product template protein